MSPDAKQTLIEKIEGLSPEQRKRVEGYVDALSERGETERAQNEDSDGSVPSEGGSRDGGKVTQGNDRLDSQDRFLRQDWAGALSDLKDEYTSLELEEEIKRQWMKMTHD
jgi:hypothetical protein